LPFKFKVLTAAAVRLATWDALDFGAKMWTIPDTQMKAQREHRVPFVSTAAVATAVEHAVRNADDSRRAPSFFFEVAAETVIACPLGLSCREKEGHHARIRFPTSPWAVVRPSHPQVVPVRWNRPAALLLRALHRGP